ncbi:MAG: hypothetical protein WCK47_05395 [bacterium]
MKKALFLAGVLVLAGLAATAQDTGGTQIESTKPVPSPDKSRSIAVDHVLPITDGEPDRYSGKMVVRVLDADGAVTQSRAIEASQARFVRPPIWLDDRWAAFNYNISKNAAGMVYADSANDYALVIEIVSAARRMGATNKTEFEIMNFDVYEYTNRPTHVRNLVRGTMSVFPLHIKLPPDIGSAPYPMAFFNELRGAMRAYGDLCTSRGLTSLLLEQDSESFNGPETHAAALACADGKPVLVIAPLKVQSAGEAMRAAVVAAIDPPISLACQSENNEEAGEGQGVAAQKPDAAAPPDRYRYLTSWKDDATVLLEKEIFDTEDEAPVKQPVLTVTLDGKITKVSPAAPPEKKAPEKSPAKIKTAPAKTKKPDGAAKTQPSPTPKTRLNLLKGLTSGAAGNGDLQ